MVDFQGSEEERSLQEYQLLNIYKQSSFNNITKKPKLNYWTIVNLLSGTTRHGLLHILQRSSKGTGFRFVGSDIFRFRDHLDFFITVKSGKAVLRYRSFSSGGLDWDGNYDEDDEDIVILDGIPSGEPPLIEKKSISAKQVDALVRHLGKYMTDVEKDQWSEYFDFEVQDPKTPWILRNIQKVKNGLKIKIPESICPKHLQSIYSGAGSDKPIIAKYFTPTQKRVAKKKFSELYSTPALEEAAPIEGMSWRMVFFLTKPPEDMEDNLGAQHNDIGNNAVDGEPVVNGNCSV